MMVDRIGRLLSILTIVLSTFFIVAAAILFFATPPNQTVWVDDKGKESCPAIELKSPIYADRGIASFAGEAVIEINDYDYLSWDTQLPSALNEYFTPDAARQYYRQFEQSGLLNAVQENYYTIVAQIVRQPVVVTTNTLEEQKVWTVELIAEIYYLTGANTIDGLRSTDDGRQYQLYTVTLIEQPPVNGNYRGVAINSISSRSLNNLENADAAPSPS